MTRSILLSILVITALTVTACEGGAQSPTAALESVPAEFAGKTNPLGADAATEGANIFKTNCEACHGPQGHGDGPAGAALNPRPKNLAELQNAVGDDYLFWRVSTGKEGTSMVAWKGVLTDEQIWQVIAFINTLK